jgi:exopolysaccharide biosynthesis polyprenyl glycosylphosphotransferase
MNKIVGFKRRPIILFGDALLIPFSYLAAFYLRFGTLTGFLEKIPLSFVFIMTLSYLAAFYFFDLYESREKYPTLTSFFEVLFGILAAGVLISFLKYTLFLFPIGRGIFVIASAILVVTMFSWRTVCYRLFDIFVKPKRTIIIGMGKAGRELSRLIRTTPNDFSLIGFIEEREGDDVGGNDKDSGGSLGSIADLISVIRGEKIDQIIVSDPRVRIPALTKQLIEARLQGIVVSDLQNIYQIIEGKIPVDHIPEEWFLEPERFGLSEKSFTAKIKRFSDIFFAILILTVSLPLWPLIAFAIKINSRGPVLYKQTRMGRNEAVFSLIKFRSMIDKAEKNGAVWAEMNDKRVTFIGKILRMLHLDELPQLINVLKGDMSLVGPRPERPEFVRDLNEKIPYYSFRHIMKPGLTGWAQVNLPYASSLEASHEKLEYDLFYISRVSLFLDLRILLKTAKGLMFGKKTG